MAANQAQTTIRNVLHPLTGTRRDVLLSRPLPATSGLEGTDRGAREIDGSDWWGLPAIFDGDAHMPFVPAGLRRSDLTAAMAGGVHHMIAALPYQLVAGRNLRALVAEMTSTDLPRITPVLSVSPSADSIDFPRWLSSNLGLVRELLPGVCKLYTGDPNFEQNLDAVWSADLKPAVFAFTQEDYARVISTAHAPLHVRHVTSHDMLASVRSVPGATCQTSPHMLLELAQGRREELSVMPVPPTDEERTSLVDSFLGIDMIASDHVSPPLGAPTGPGLQTQQHFLAAVLTCTDRYGWDIRDVWPKVTTAPAAIFGVRPNPGLVIVAPDEPVSTGLWPLQKTDRAPYLGTELKGRVIAITDNGTGELV